MTETSLAKRPADDQLYRNFANPVNPWSRQKGEGGKAFEAFTVFRNLGSSRSRAEVARRIGYKNVTMLERWAKQFFWDERASEWDADQEKKIALWTEGQKQEMVERHSKISISMLEIVQRKLKAMMDDPEMLKYLTVADVTQWVKVASELERICKGGIADEKTSKDIANLVQIIWQGPAPNWAKVINAKGESIEFGDQNPAR